jgi:signal transduction histidine kinase/ActR/RegA family two-component response regulator
MFPTSADAIGETQPALDPERILKRDFFYHLPSVTLVLLVAWPTTNHAMILSWAGIILSLVKLEHWWTARGAQRTALRRAGSLALTFAIDLCYAFAAAVLVAAKTPSASLFSCILLVSSMTNVLLRYFRRPWAFLIAVSPQASILGIIGVSLVAGHLKQGHSLEALAPAATVALFVLLFWAARDQLSNMHKALALATKTAQEGERAARDASQAKSEFLATMSHEIRTPLNGVLGMAQAMTHEDLGAAQRERLQVIRRCGESLLAIVDDVLDLSKIEAGKLQLEAIPFDLDEVARGAAATFSANAKAKGLTFVFDIDPDACGRYLGDPTRLRQVMHNLISNAVKFTHVGGVSVTIERRGGGLLRLGVQDTGIGISPEHRAKLFDKFVQVDASTTRQYGGSGLGLAIARELVTAMGGTIEVESAVGRGSTFTATIAVERLADPEPQVVGQVENRVDGALRVLAAEDNPVNQEVLKAVLGQADVTPTIVGNGREAVEAWEAGDWDIILMDIQMPEMDGVAATRAIRQREAECRRKRTPILAITANTMRHQALEYRAAGIDGLTAKPIDIVKLFEAMDQVMQSPGAAWEASLAS